VIIEMLGAPGAGKTTMIVGVEAGCRAQGLTPFTVEEAARPFAARTVLGRVASRVVPARFEDAALWGVYRLASGSHTVRLALRNIDLTRYVLTSQRGRPPEADASERRVLYWYMRMMGSYGFLRAMARPTEAIVIDEGFVHRTVQLHSSPVESPTAMQVAAYLARLPRPDLVVSVNASPAVCRLRVQERGVWARLGHRPPAEIERFLQHAHETTTLVRAEMEHGGWPVIDIDNNREDPHEAIATVGRAVAESGLAPLVRSMGPPPLKPLGAQLLLPKPSRVTGWIAARTHAPRISEADAALVVAQFGQELLGKPANLPLTWRNHLVVVRTSAGRKVLKEYRETSNIDTIAHEHSIIDHLEERRFPATQLDHTPSGSSVVEVGGRLHASFEFEPGRHLAATFLSAEQRRAVTTEAGRAMARLHRELTGFQPVGHHHLGVDSDGGRERDLAWHLAALDRLRNSPARPEDTQAERDVQWLWARSDQHRRDLIEAADRVHDANAPQQLIHGDFGAHNLLFRRDGTTVVHDFELARFDWRLLDIVIASLRLPPARQGAFIAGYRQAGDLPSAELRLLPWLWRYHLLSGAIRSWERYREIGGQARAATARARLVRVESGPGEVLEQWQ